MFYWIDDGTPAPANFQETKTDKRWVEIWNDVFMQYQKQADGKLLPLEKPNVDTGMGLDRTLAVLNGQKSVYDTELFAPMWEVLALDQEIMTNDEVKRARIIVDHIRAAVFIVGDGVEPSNKDRGYVLRRLLRRAMVMGKLLNLKHHWLEALIGKVIATYAEAYPDLIDKSEHIFAVIKNEQEKFEGTLEKGLREFEKRLSVVSPFMGSSPDKTADKSANYMTGKDAFDLYQTYGFPWELTKELAKQSGQAIDKSQFESEFKKHQELSRTASAGQFKGGLASHSDKIVRLHTATHLMNAALGKYWAKMSGKKGVILRKSGRGLILRTTQKLRPRKLS